MRGLNWLVLLFIEAIFECQFTQGVSGQMISQFGSGFWTVGERYQFCTLCILYFEKIRPSVCSLDYSYVGSSIKDIILLPVIRTLFTNERLMSYGFGAYYPHWMASIVTVGITNK